MANRRRQIDPRQSSLLDLVEKLRQAPERPAPGALACGTQFKDVLSRALRGCDRWDVAAAMSRLCDADISKYMLDAWVAPSKEGHRLPAELLPAFCQACESLEPLEYLVARSGGHLVPGEDVLRARIERLEGDLRAKRSEIRTARALLKEVKA